MKTRVLKILFNRNLMSYELPYFRASVIEATSRQSDLFHNHKANKEVIYRYPLIQYKIIDRKPAIICFNAGTDDIHYLLENREFFFDIKGDVQQYEIEELNLKYHRIQTWNSGFRYNVHNYIPFNQDNYATFKKLGGMKQQLAFIEELLQKHLQLIINEFELPCPEPLWVEIEQIKSDKFIEYKKIFHMTYCLNIKTNLSLPNYMGVGKGISTGFGIVKKIGSN